VDVAQAWGAVAGSVVRTGRLLARRQLRMPRTLVGQALTAEDGTCSTVFRETVRVGGGSADPVVLVVRFRLRWIGAAPWAHAVFRRTCVVNTPLFAGFPGFVSKLWLTDTVSGVYRGLYEWNGAARAERYAARLRRVLALVTVPGSVGHLVVPGTDRRPYVTGERAFPPA